MSELRVYLKRKEIHIEVENIHIRYTASLCLRRLVEIKSYNKELGLLIILCENEYKDGTRELEEEYLDIRDILNDYKYDTDKILSYISEIKIGENKVTKQELIEN